MTAKLYRIAWESNVTDATGHGTGKFPFEEAKRYADRLNIQGKDIGLYHFPCNCDTSDYGPATIDAEEQAGLDEYNERGQ